MPIELKDLEELLGKFKEKVASEIDGKIKQQSDAANADVAKLKEQFESVNKALEDIKKAKDKPFGLPGLEHEKSKWNWDNFYTGIYKEFMAGRGAVSYDDVKKHWDTIASFEKTVCKDYTAGSGSTGGYIVPPQIYQGDIIDIVYANTAILKMPILKFSNLQSDMPIPIDEGHLTSYHLGETEAPTKSSATFGLKWLRPKKIGTYVKVSQRIFRETTGAIGTIVKGKMALDASVELSRALTNGKGSESEGEGIIGFYPKFSDTKNLGTTGRRMTIDDLGSMLYSLECADEWRDTNTYGLITHPGALWGMKRETVEQYSSQTNGKGAFRMPRGFASKADLESFAGMKIETTTQMPLGAGSGLGSTTCKVIAGDWSKFAFASFRDPEFRVSDIASDSSTSAFLNDQIFMVMFQEYDCTCLRPAAFTGRDGAETKEASW